MKFSCFFFSALVVALFSSSVRTVQGLKKVVDCTRDERIKMEDVADYAADNWNSLERYVERETGYSIGNCLRNRFEDNGRVECEDKIQGMCKSNTYGWASFLSKRIHICPKMRELIDDLSDDGQKKACWLAIMIHEYAHTCWRNEKKSDAIEIAAFDWYVDKKSVSGSGFCDILAF